MVPPDRPRNQRPSHAKSRVSGGGSPENALDRLRIAHGSTLDRTLRSLMVAGLKLQFKCGCHLKKTFVTAMHKIVQTTHPRTLNLTGEFSCTGGLQLRQHVCILCAPVHDARFPRHGRRCRKQALAQHVDATQPRQHACIHRAPVHACIHSAPVHDACCP